jgi:signal transduction histidine kinase
MENFYQQMTNLLINPPGNLIYHIVLAFAVTAAIEVTLISRRAGQSEYLGRVLFGLGLVLGAQMVLFLTSGLTWQGLDNFNPRTLLPPLDRLVTLFSVLWLTWLWGFPRPSRIADSLAGLTTVVMVIAFFFTLTQWSGQPPTQTFNGSEFDWPWELLALVILLVGTMVLIIRQPNAWGIGLGFVLLNLAGHTIQFLWPVTGSNYSGILRLAQMSSFLLLPALAQRLVPDTTPQSQASTKSKSTPTVSESASDQKAGSRRDRRRYSADARAVHAWLDIAIQTEPPKILAAMTRSVAQTMLADICFFLDDPGPVGDVVFRLGYDLIREEEIPGVMMGRERMPSLATALQRGKPYRLDMGSTSPELKTLGERFGLGVLGSLLFIPVTTPEKNMGGFLLLSPYSDRTWTTEDQNYFAASMAAMVQILQRTSQPKAAEGGFQSPSSADIEIVMQKLNQVQQDNQRLTTELDNLRKQPVHPELEALLAVQKEAQETIANLQAENERLKTATKAGRNGKSSTQAEMTHLELELRQTLQEVARLQNKIGDANTQILTLQKQANLPMRMITEEREVVASISQELRQPMASISGYTDLLISESAGILGALQRKFLDRIKNSIERMRSILDDLAQITSQQGGQIHLATHTIQAGAAIDQAIAETRSQIQDKNILLQVDLPEELPEMHADRDAIEQILIHLLQNAGTVTPAEGTITLKARIDDQNTSDPYLLFQITDTGGGIAPADLSRVFSRRYRTDNATIQGVGDTGVGLSIAKTLTEAHGGRIWVESEPGKTTTFSVLLPIRRKIDPEVSKGAA